MRDYLLFTLYGPMQSWGTSAAVGEVRPTAGHPTRSGVMGLIAAALGIRRHEEDRLAALSGGYGLAVAAHASGGRLVDYHTVQVGGAARGRVYRTRSDEVGGMLPHGEEPNTILSDREYLTDACFVACLWAANDAPPHSLDHIRQALLTPCFTPSLGRKSCPAGVPFDPAMVRAADAGEALLGYSPCRGTSVAARRLLCPDGAGELQVWADAGHGITEGKALLRATVRDRVSHHGRRQFVLREEAHLSLSRRRKTS
jgi:CRISPR system Cascade subunit CasD